MFEVGDLVRIVSKPDNQCVDPTGEVGLVDEIQTTPDRIFAYFKGIKMDGHMSGCGSVPLECLVHERSEAWLKAKELYLARQAKYRAEADAHQTRWLKFLDEMVIKYGLPKETLVSIHRDLGAWDP